MCSQRDKGGMPDTAAPRPEAGSAEPCVSCGERRLGLYCQACGEKRLDPERDHSLRWLLAHAADAVLQLDGKLLRAYGALLLQPGRLTRHHLDGARVRFLGPLPLFLFTSVAFYLLFSKAYAAPLQTLARAYTNDVWMGNLLRVDVAALLQAKATATGQSVETVAIRAFDRAGQESKLFLGAIVPCLAGTLWLLYRRREARFVPHLVTAMHLFTTFLVFDLVFLLGWQASGRDQVSDEMFLPLLAGFAAHTALALRRVHRDSVLGALWRVAVLMVALVGTIVLYRQVVTIVVLWLT